MNHRYLIVLFLLLGGCGKSTDNAGVLVGSLPSPGGELIESSSAASYPEARAAAVAAIQIAAEKRNVWSTSDTLLKKSQTAFSGGDEVHAIELADRARVQAELAARQADREKEAWRDNVLSN